ncbi:MAG: hypothetical protein KGN79_13060 [Acidobacteriota bacterium]|nr:hypothetical protein [Acidobacteriota bacterium]
MASALESPRLETEGSKTTEEEKRRVQQERAARERQKQSLNLQKEQILSQRTSSPLRRQALEAALNHIELQLEALD